MEPDRKTTHTLLKRAGYPEFPLGVDGYPDPGHVVRYFRERMTYIDPKTEKTKAWTQADLAKRLGVSEVTVRLMETQHKGLDSIERRRVLADLLKIPPALLGLASLSDLLETLDHYQQAPTRAKQSQSRVNAATVKLYQDAFSVYSQMHTTNTAQDALADIEQWIARIQGDLPEIPSQQRAALLHILWNFHALSAKIYGEDSCNWISAFEHLNASLEIATALSNPDLQAASLYRSSAVHVAQKNFALAQSALDGALLSAKKAQAHIKGAVLVDAALVHATTSTDLAGVTYAQHLLDQAEQYIGAPVDDGVMNFSEGKYQLIKARTLIALHRPGKALECLDDAEAGIDPRERRRLAFLDILRAECYTRMKRPEYDTALLLLIEALATSKTIKSTFNIKHIARLYKALATSNYGTSPQVADLGLSLKEWH